MKKTTSTILSKSKYLAGVQCLKLLWFHYNAKEQFPPVDEATQTIFDQGHEVGLLARQLFPGGIEITTEHTNLGDVNRLSREALASRKPLYEAGFIAGNVFARADILNPVRGGAWDIIEVKSGTSVKDVNLDDLTFQHHVYKQAGLRIRKSFILHINSGYVRRGEIEVAGLFTLEDVSEEVGKRLPDVPQNVARMLQTIKGPKFPEILIGTHCDDPYECPLKDICWKSVPERSVFTLTRSGRKAFEWFHGGYRRLTDLDRRVVLTKSQQVQVRATVCGKPFVDGAAIRSFLATLEYPLYFLDFETCYGAIPLFDHSRPYQQIPFQFSLHVVERPGARPCHHLFLADDATDPRAQFIDRLKPLLSARGGIVAYNASFEKQRLQECGELFPRHKAWLQEIELRFVDLQQPFRSFAYYHPSQDGSASLKAVLPVLTGRGYDQLVIQDGGSASQEFLRMTRSEVGAGERKRIRAALEKYCCRDTEGMIRIVERLRKLAA